MPVQNAKAKGKATGGPNAAAKPGDKHAGGRKRLDNASKKQQLEALTRQAEANTKMLERERAAVLAFGIEQLETQSLSDRFRADGQGGMRQDAGYPSDYGGGYDAQVNQQPAGRTGREQRNRMPSDASRGGYQDPYSYPPGSPSGYQVGQPRNQRGPPDIQTKQPSKAHNFLHAQKKVFDPNSIPGLGGGGGGGMGGPRSPGGPVFNHHGASTPWAGGMLGHPNHTAHYGTPPHGFNDTKMSDTFPDSPGFFPGMVFGVPGTPGAQSLGPPISPVGAQGRLPPQVGRQAGPGTFAPPPYNPQYQQQPSNPGRAWQQQQQQQQHQYPPQPLLRNQQPPPYHDGQSFPYMDARMQAPPKQQEDPRAAYRRELEEQVRQKKAAKEAEAEARRREDERYATHWDAHRRSPHGRGGGGEPLLGPSDQPMADVRRRHQDMYPLEAFPGGPPSAGYPSAQPPPHMYSPHGGQSPGLMVQVPNPSGGGRSPGPGHSLGTRNNRMAGLNELRAGPSEDQRNAAEVARLKLQDDLREQIRQKKEREAREKAAELEAERKEEEALQAYFRSQQQRETEVAAQKNRADGSTHRTPPPWEGPPGGLSLGGPAAASVPDPAPHAGRRAREGKKVIDAPWLDAIQPPKAEQKPGDDVVAGLGGMRSRRNTNNGDMPSPGMNGARIPGLLQSPSGNFYSGGGNLSPDATVKTLLSALQEEQVRLREEFARQAHAVEKLASNADQAAKSRDQAWKELNRVRQSLQDGGPGFASCDAIDQFVVETHMVPKSQNDIPSRLSTPMEAAWAKEMMNPAVRSPGGGYDGGGVPPMYYNEVDLDSLDQLLKRIPAGSQEDDMLYPHNKYYRTPTAEQGLYRPISDVAGNPSRIPRAPAPPGRRGGAPAASPGPEGGPPRSRFNSFLGQEAKSPSGLPGMPVQRRAVPPKPPAAANKPKAPKSASAVVRQPQQARVQPVQQRGVSAAAGEAYLKQWAAEQEQVMHQRPSEKVHNIPSAPTATDSLAKVLSEVKSHLHKPSHISAPVSPRAAGGRESIDY